VPWLATAYVAGPSLTEAVRGHGPLPIRSTLALAAGLAEGLSAIHAAGVVHRDLKPSNVLLAEDGPRVIDFGISEAAEASAVAGANVLIGSPGYMSPEQVLGADIGPASDMFSLGSVLTFAATGTGPFGTGSNAALMYRLVNTPANLGDVPGELRSLVGSCLAKFPGDRPTARELLAEVGALQPAPGWLAESIMNSFIQDPPAPVADLAAAGKQVAVIENFAQPPRSGQPPRGGTGGPGRHRISRSLASACLTGGLVAGSAVAAFALLGANHTPAASHLQPQAGAAASPNVPATASSAPAVSPPASSSAPSKARVSPAMFVSPAALSGSSGTSLPPTPIVSQSSAPPTKAPHSSAPPSSTPPSSKPPSSTPPSSTPPSSTPPSSTPPSSTPPSSTPPSSTPPSSTPPSSTPPSSSDPAPSVSVSVSLSV
jgi:eukaryotic-like serine/threonine-protein kinase